jgi:hypothetical protein
LQGRNTVSHYKQKNYSFKKLYNIVPRAEVQSGSPRGKQLTEIMEKGELVPLVSHTIDT